MFTLLRVIGMPPGASQPAQIQIVGLFSCPSGGGGIPVELRVTAPLGGPITTFTQLTSTGAPSTPPFGTVVFSVPAWAAANCGEKIQFEVRGDCGSAGWTQWQTFGGEIECLCPRVSLQASYGACSGNPLKQTITLTATIMLKPGTTSQFTWDVKDKNNILQHAAGPAGGSLTNTTSNWNTPLTLTTTYDLDPSQGPYSACMSSPECPSACITIRPNCNGCCDEVTVTVDTQPLPCVPAGGGTVSIQFSASLLPTGCTGPFEWKVTDVATNTVLQPFALGSSTFSYPFASAGTYRVNVKVQQASTCDDPVLTDSVTFILVECTQCPTLAVNATVSGCAPTNAVVNLSTQLAWPGGSGPAATMYFWTIDGPGSTTKAQRTGPSSVDTSSGWSGTLATSSGAVDLSQAGTYTVSVRAQIPGVPATCDPTDSANIVIPPCRCPAPIANTSQEWSVTGITAPLGPNSFQTSDCDRATVSMTLAVDLGGYQPGDLRYRWDFGDGSPVVTQQGTAGASQTHTFSNPTPGRSQTYTVTVTVDVAGSTCAPFSRTASITVPACTTSVCPQVNQVTPDRATDCINRGGTVTFNFTAAVNNPSAVAGGFQWDFGNGTTQTTQGPSASHSYNGTGTFTVRLTVNGPSGGNCPPSSQTTTITVTPCSNGDGGGGMSISCWILLILALVFIVAAAALAMIASCAGNNPYIYAASAIAFVIGMIFLVLWGIFCARFACPIVVTVIDILAALSAASLIIAAILNFFGCSLGAFIGSGYLGTALAVAYAIGRLTRCIRT